MNDRESSQIEREIAAVWAGTELVRSTRADHVEVCGLLHPNRVLSLARARCADTPVRILTLPRADAPGIDLVIERITEKTHAR